MDLKENNEKVSSEKGWRKSLMHFFAGLFMFQGVLTFIGEVEGEDSFSAAASDMGGMAFLIIGCAFIMMANSKPKGIFDGHGPVFLSFVALGILMASIIF